MRAPSPRSALRSFGGDLVTVSGRTTRARWWLIGVLSLLTEQVLAGLLEVVGVAAARSPLLRGVSLTLGVLSILASIRRLHDRDKSGHWLWPLYGLPALIMTLVPVLMTGPARLALTIWIASELGALRGTAGPNRFGPRSPGLI
jgi:uncharacterized membrane protein YhaH (DUF805 family)